MLLSIFMVLTLCYYLSRVVKKNAIAFWIFIFAAYALIAANFFLNSGIEGSTAIVCLLVTSIVFSVASDLNKLVLTLIQALLFGGLLYHQYDRGNTYILEYPDRLSEYLDQYMTYVISTAFLYVVFEVITRKYEKQRQSLLEKEQKIQE